MKVYEWVQKVMPWKPVSDRMKDRWTEGKLDSIHHSFVKDGDKTGLNHLPDDNEFHSRLNLSSHNVWFQRMVVHTWHKQNAE